MNKMGRKFMALLVVFTSIISFLPNEFGGNIASAASINSDATIVQAYETGSEAVLPVRTDAVTKEIIYTTTTGVTTGFDIAVKDRTTTLSKIKQEVTDTSASSSGIIMQKLDIVSINGTPCYTDAANTILNPTLVDIGIGIGTFGNVPNTAARIGKTITGLPFGVNKIAYKITITTQSVDYVKPVNDVIQDPKVNDPEITAYASQSLTIEHATGFVITKINPMMFNAYVGKKADLANEEYMKNNTVPFQYSREAKPDSNMALRYTFDVPDSYSTLEYNMTFDTTMVLDNAKVYKNGVEDTTYNITGHVLTGSLARLGQSDLIVVKLDPSLGTDKNIQKAYAIEIRYNNLSSNQDYGLKEAGITKLNYENDKSVLAYVGKEFKITNENIFPTYNGEITIDKKASMISLDPTLMRSKSTLAYVVTNYYVDDTGTPKSKQSVLKNGQQFIDFMAGSINKLQVDVYEGTNGTKTGSTPLARYYFKVNLLTGNDFNMALKFTSSGSTYLTQPGVKGNVIDKFTTDRRTYDLYTPDPVTIALTGARSNKNEYIKVWLGDEVESNNLKESTASSSNVLNYNDPNAQDYLERNPSLDNIDFGKSKKIVVQAYYDEFEYDSKGELKTNSDGVPIYISYSIGDKYVFYLPSNFTDTDNPKPGDKSDNAALSLLKVEGGTLKDTDGNSGFSSDKFDYTVTIPKEDISAKIMATAQDDNVRSIIATINGESVPYELVSGEKSELPLNSSGKTTIQIVVTAQDEITTSKYTVTFQNNSKGSNVNLKNVILNVGDYTFDSKEDITKVRVDQNVNNVKVTPIAEDSKSKVTVNGEEFLESPIGVNLRGNQKVEVNIEVISEDGTSSRTYTLEIYRVDIADWENDPNDDNDANDEDQFYDEYNECWVDLTKYDEWGTVNGKPTYFDKKSRQVKEAWISTGGKTYYLNNLGYRASGWKIDKADGKTYYLDSTTGELKKGWMNLNNSWYYLQLNGVMKKGWLNLNKKWYYFLPNGQMVINQSMFVDDKVYNFGQDGAIY